MSDQREGIKCAKCGCQDLRVLETRKNARMIIRRRECRHCGHRVTTREKTVEKL